MSNALYKMGGLRFWNENELELRELFLQRITGTIKRTLLDINPAWKFYRCETPPLIPREFISEEYKEDDLFITNHDFDGKPLALRAETTHGSYTFIKDVYKTKPFKKALPVCVWQEGYSFRTENTDGATAAKLRFNAFKQLEYQCIYSEGTMADYRSSLIKSLVKEIERFTMVPVRVVDSDRLPSYSLSTVDIECLYNDDWKEVASCSIRNDFEPETLVAEIAIGLCRIVSIAK